MDTQSQPFLGVCWQVPSFVTATVNKRTIQSTGYLRVQTPQSSALAPACPFCMSGPWEVVLQE